MSEATISAIDHSRESSLRERLRAHRRIVDGRGSCAPPLGPRIVAVGAILAAGIALAATLGLSADLTAADPERSVGHAVSGHDRVQADPARSHTQARSERRAHQLPSVGESPADTLPFPPNPAGRATRPGEVPSLYADGLPCSTGCRPYGAEIGWPLAPFHAQHPIRAGLNELRANSLHVGVDIQARDGSAVYAVQPGVARVLAPSGPNARVQVGNYIYWHITPRVWTGELVIPFETVLGTVMAGYGHIAFSELGAGGQYVNPLRPGGTVLEPYVDRAPPVIGAPSVAAGGQVIVAAYDPQTYVRRTTYVTPVLAPAAIAYRLYDTHGTAVTPLEWAFRGTHLLSYLERSLIYAPGARAPGYACFATQPVCVPHWIYRVAGGLAPPLPPGLATGRYRLTVYAWDWADNKTALDTTVTLTATGWRPVGRFPTVLLHVPGYFSQTELFPPIWSGGVGHAPAQAVPADPVPATSPRAPGARSPATSSGGAAMPPATTPPSSSPRPLQPNPGAAPPSTN
jgi:hypothetical protein